MKKPKEPSGKHYCIITFFPTLSYVRDRGTEAEEVRYINQALMIFENGRYITDDEITDYCGWYCTGNRVFLDEVNRVPLEEARELRKSSNGDVEWNYCSYDFFKRWRQSFNT